MDVNTVAVCFVVLPDTVIDISVNVIKLASPASNVVPPAALILCTVGPDLDAESMPFVGANFQLPLVHRTVRENHLLSELESLLIKQEI